MKMVMKKHGLKCMMSALCVLAAMKGHAAERLEENQAINTSGLEFVQRPRTDSYRVTDHQKRAVEIEVIPEVIAFRPRFCVGHWQNPWGMNHYYCNPGCRGGERYISHSKQVNVIRDVWVGCAALERLKENGQAVLISEEYGVLNQTRVIEGEPMTRDYWEKTGTYALNRDVFDAYTGNVTD
jgi:hypothetical protein